MVKISKGLEGYRIRKCNESIIVFNEIYEANMVLLLISVILCILAPSKNDIRLPIAINIFANESDIVYIDENLNVSGVLDYSYFIPLSHYRKWKYTYLAFYCIVLILMICICVLFIYLIISQAGFSKFVFIALLGIAVFLISLLLKKFLEQYTLKKKYPLCDGYGF